MLRDRVACLVAGGTNVAHGGDPIRPQISPRLAGSKAAMSARILVCPPLAPSGRPLPLSDSTPVSVRPRPWPLQPSPPGPEEVDHSAVHLRPPASFGFPRPGQPPFLGRFDHLRPLACCACRSLMACRHASRPEAPGARVRCGSWRSRVAWGVPRLPPAAFWACLGRPRQRAQPSQSHPLPGVCECPCLPPSLAGPVVLNGRCAVGWCLPLASRTHMAPGRTPPAAAARPRHPGRGQRGTGQARGPARR